MGSGEPVRGSLRKAEGGVQVQMQTLCRSRPSHSEVREPRSKTRQTEGIRRVFEFDPRQTRKAKAKLHRDHFQLPCTSLQRLFRPCVVSQSQLTVCVSCAEPQAKRPLHALLGCSGIASLAWLTKAFLG